MNRIFETGIEIEGTIDNVWFYKDRGRINFTYYYKEKLYHSGNPVMKKKKTKSLSKGMTVALLINPNNNKKAIIKDLYY